MLFLMQLFTHASKTLEYDKDELYQLYKELENCDEAKLLEICDVLLVEPPKDYLIEKTVAICNDYRLASAFKIWEVKYDTAI
jgi:hypothetical protein